jgi:hypothetical protein
MNESASAFTGAATTSAAHLQPNNAGALEKKLHEDRKCADDLVPGMKANDLGDLRDAALAAELTRPIVAVEALAKDQMAGQTYARSARLERRSEYNGL